MTVLYRWHTIWTADGMWHWYKMIVQTVLYSWHTIWAADGVWNWYKMIVQPGNHTTGQHWTV
jgi:hypothetical protein